MPRADASRQRCGRLEQEFTSLAAQREAFIRSQRNDLSSMRDAAALARCTLAALIAPQNDPPNGQDLVPGQQFVLVSLGKRLLDIAVGGAGDLHGDIGRHDTALDGGEETLLTVFEQITDRGDVIGGESIFLAISVLVYPRSLRAPISRISSSEPGWRRARFSTKLIT